MVLLVLAGCGWGDGTPEASPANTSVPATAAHVEPTEPAGPLNLNLRVGDRFPMLKTVAQILTQTTPRGQFSTHSRLEVLLAIEVDEVLPDGRKRLGVRYDRVRYRGDAGGRPVEFDSQSPGPLPPELRPYRGMVGNGFAFWLGPDNALLELVGFHDFLQRCVRDVPADRRQAVLHALVETTGREAVAQFIDAGVGLLPSSPGATAIQIGDRWEHRRRMRHPLPLVLHTECTLADLNDRVAEIDIAGTIAAASDPAADPPQGVAVTVRGGRTLGHCTLDRATGLPLDSRVEHTLDMLVQPAQGEPFPQRKQTVTTVRAFPQQVTAVSQR